MKSITVILTTAIVCLMLLVANHALASEDDDRSLERDGEPSLPRELAGAEAVEKDEFTWSNEIEFTKDSGEREITFTNEATYGLADRWELVFEVPMETVVPKIGSPAYGLGDIEIGTHYGLPERMTNPFFIDLGLAVVLPTGDFSRGLGDGRVSFQSEFAANYQAGQVGFEAAAAWKTAVTSGGDDPANEFEFTGGLSYTIKDWSFVLAGGAEITYEETKCDLKPEVVWSPTEQLEFHVVIPIGLNSAADDYGFIIGMTVQFEHLLHRNSVKK